MGETKEDIKTVVSSENGAQVSTLEVVTITVLSNLIVRVNVVSNISLLIVCSATFPFSTQNLKFLEHVLHFS